MLEIFAVLSLPKLLYKVFNDTIPVAHVTQSVDYHDVGLWINAEGRTLADKKVYWLI
jgi:hypothetical protein